MESFFYTGRMKKDPKKRHILVVDTHNETLEQVLEPLRWEGYEARGVQDLKQALELMQVLKPQIIVLDPIINGKLDLESITSFYRSSPNTSLILFSHQKLSSEEIAQCFDLGASDYLQKPVVPLEFLARVRAHLRTRDMHDELLFANDMLKELVDIDDLTGLFNMRSLYQRLDFEIERGRRFHRPLCVVMMDMDHFKTVNDGHDHLFGSYVISEVGKIIRGNTRNIDIPARYGGDEFLIVLSETPLEGSKYFCERLRKAIESTTFTNGNDSIRLTISLGFAMTENGESITAKELVRRADMALYKAKHEGRNRVAGYDPYFDKAFRNKTLTIEPRKKVG